MKFSTSLLFHSNFRYEINAAPLNQISKEDNCVVESECATKASSTKVSDLKIGVASFCKAFPWHFVTDKRLELLQLGKLLIILNIIIIIVVQIFKQYTG